MKYVGIDRMQDQKMKPYIFTGEIRTASTKAREEKVRQRTNFVLIAVSFDRSQLLKWNSTAQYRQLGVASTFPKMDMRQRFRLNMIKYDSDTDILVPVYICKMCASIDGASVSEKSQEKGKVKHFS